MSDRAPPSRPSSSEKRSHPKNRAFSLLEVTIAVGITFLAIVTILGLTPVGLETLTEAARQSARAEIFKLVAAELESTPFDELDAFITERFPVYFDFEGVELEPENVDEAVYTATCNLSGLELNGQIRRARIQVGFHSNPSSGGTSSTSRVHSRPVILVDKGI